jgi:hypothetical protein
MVGRALGAEPFAIDDGLPGVWISRTPERPMRSSALPSTRRTAPRRPVLRQRADARDRQVVLQLLDVTIPMEIDEVDDFVVH